MNLSQLRIYAVRPVLQTLHLWSETAEDLVLGTGLVESGYEFIDQDDWSGLPGPAYGFFQMESLTYYDIWNNFLAYRPELKDLVRDLDGHRASPVPPVESLRTNIALAVAMCRLKYLRIPEALPPDTPLALASYWKLHYNTLLGKGSVVQALPHFQRVCSS